MSNLIPEKRVNKNGVAVTKHVRASAKPDADPKVPAPKLSGASRTKPAKTKPLTKKQLEQNYNSLHRKYFVPDADLKESLRNSHGYPRMNELYVFTCSDAETYEVLSVAGFDNAGALLDAGFRTKEAAAGYLREHRLEHLITDESEVVKEALNRGIPALYVFDTYRKNFSASGNALDSELLLDAAEARAHKGMRDARFTPSIPDRVASGEISMEDIRTIGATRFLKALEPNGFLLNQLKELKDGKLDYSAEQIKETILRFTDVKGAVNTHNVRGTLAVARVYGYETASKLKHPAYSSPLMLAIDGSEEEKLRAVNYAESVVPNVKSRMSLSVQLLAQAYRSGATTEQAVDYINGDITMEQIIAINEHEVPPSISGGWL